MRRALWLIILALGFSLASVLPAQEPGCTERNRAAIAANTEELQRLAVTLNRAVCELRAACCRRHWYRLWRRRKGCR